MRHNTNQSNKAAAIALLIAASAIPANAQTAGVGGSNGSNSGTSARGASSTGAATGGVGAVGGPSAGTSAPVGTTNPGAATAAPGTPASPGIFGGSNGTANETQSGVGGTTGSGEAAQGTSPTGNSNTGNNSNGGGQMSGGLMGNAPSYGLSGASNADGSNLGIVSTAPGTGNVPPVTLTLAETINLTLGSSSSLDIASRNLDRDLQRVREAQAAGGFKVNANATGTHFDAPTEVAFGSQKITVEPQDVGSAGINASLPIDLTGQIRAQTDVEKLQLLADRFQRDTISNELILSAQTAYFNVLRAQHQVQVAEAALTNAQTQASLSGSQYQAGTGQRIDVLRAQTQVATAQQDLLSAQNSLALTDTNFNDVVGRPLNAQTNVVDVAGVTQGVTTTTPPQYVPEAPSVPNPVTGPSTTTPVGPPTSSPVNQPPAQTASVPVFFRAPFDQLNAINVDASIQTATNARPELREDLVQVQADDRSIKLARSGLEPTLVLSAGGTYYPKVSFASPRSQVGEITATINLPLYDSGYTRDRVREARDETQNAQTTYESNVTDVALQVRQGYLNMQTAAQQIDAANIALQEAVSARELAQLRYQGGVGLYLEVTDAESALTTAETSQVNSVYDYLIARAQFQNAIGIPDLNPTLPATFTSTPSPLPATPPELPQVPDGLSLPSAPTANTPAEPSPTVQPQSMAPGAPRTLAVSHHATTNSYHSIAKYTLFTPAYISNGMRLALVP